jgi:crotonobetainyl-CoA hydratase
MNTVTEEISHLDLHCSNAVLAEVRGNVLVITLNRPEVRNAIDADSIHGVARALEYAENNNRVRAVILTGAGDKAFCAGADLKAAAAGDIKRLAGDALDKWGFAGYVRHPISKPTIAAVNGFALGGGTELVLASDLAVAADTAIFGLPEVKRGLLAAAGGAFRIASQVPPKLALELLLTGDSFGAARALDLGMVNAVVPADRVLDTAMDLARRIAANAPLAVQASKRTFYGISEDGQDGERAQWKVSDAEAQRLMTSKDSQEGLRAFAEKREPLWQGR